MHHRSHSLIQVWKGRVPNWPGVELIQSKLFICAAVACSFIREAPNPDLRMTELLDTRWLDDLHLTVLEQSLVGINLNLERNNWMRVIGTIVTARTAVEMDVFLGLLTKSRNLRSSVSMMLIYPAKLLFCAVR